MIILVDMSVIWVVELVILTKDLMVDTWAAHLVAIKVFHLVIFAAILLLSAVCI